MLKGLYLSKAGMLPQKQQLEVAANNLANINTIGYKKEDIFFRHLVNAVNASDPAQGEQKIDFSEGALRHTGNPLDAAIVGDGFFVVQTDQGEAYTRNGSFSLDGEGRLVTQSGDPVLSDSGELQIQGKSVKINEKGELLVDGQSVGRLRIVTFDDPQRLLRIGKNYFSQGDTVPSDVPEDDVDIRGGFLEGSNVNGIQEMISLIDLNRNYELGQKSIQSQDRTLDKLINEAGRF